jgi:uncharacterized protein (DUF1501 family)
MASSRRDFLSQSGMVALGAYGAMSMSEMHAQAQSTPTDPNKPVDPDAWRQKPTLVCIYLRGGADALHAFVPVEEASYYKFRPSIAIPAKGKGNRPGALSLATAENKGTYWGMNPHMKSLLPLWEKGMVAPIMNVGSPDGTRSHFEAQDYMERGAPGNKRITQGWLNRYLYLSRRKTDAPLRALSARSLLPRALRGQYPVLAGNNKTQEMDTFEELYAKGNMVNKTKREGGVGQKGSSLFEIPNADGAAKEMKRKLTAEWARDVITESGTQAIERIKALESAQSQPTTGNYPRGGLSGQLRTIAKCIKANVGMEVAQADYGGWDSHRGQGDVNGNVSRKLGHVADCISAFMTDLGDRNNKVRVLVMSEFGREVKENGAKGTDHGRGGFMLAVGGEKVMNGGKMYGQWKGLGDLNYGRFQPVRTDFRTVFSEALVNMFEFKAFDGKMFPGYRGNEQNFLGFMNKVELG